MEITNEFVQQVAKNARLTLTDAEIEQFKKDFQDILAQFSVLDDAPVENINPAFHPVPLKDAVRADVETKSLSQKEALQNVADSKDGYIRGPKVL